MSALVFVAGAAYCGCLWDIAARVARVRLLPLGELPYWLVAICGGVACACAQFMTPHAAMLGAATLIGALVCALVDARTGFIFDALCASMTAVAAVVALRGGRFPDGVLAVAVVGGGLLLLYLLTGRRGIGLGDVKLGAAIALGYGLRVALISLGCAFVSGALFAVALVLLGRAKRSDSLRFGPFIAGGAALGLGADVLGWFP